MAAAFWRSKGRGHQVGLDIALVPDRVRGERRIEQFRARPSHPIRRVLSWRSAWGAVVQRAPFRETITIGPAFGRRRQVARNGP